MGARGFPRFLRGGWAWARCGCGTRRRFAMPRLEVLLSIASRRCRSWPWVRRSGGRSSRRARANAPPPLGGIVYLFTACVACTLLGVAITFSPVEVCSVFAHPVDHLGV